MIGWRNKCRLYLLSNKESVFIIVLYTIYVLCYETAAHGVLVVNTATIFMIFVPNIVFYCVLGLVGEVFIGRQKLINFSLWVQWIAMISSTVVSAMMYSSYHFPQWLETLLIAVPSVVQFFGLAAFQVTAIQYGIDLFQGAPSKHLSAFIYWYFCMEFTIPTVLAWVIYLLSKYALVTDTAIQLGCSLLSTFLLSFVLCVKNLFMSHWLKENPENDTSLCCQRQSNLAKRNPCSLIYHVLKFAIKHKTPLQRSAFTYWEENLPSRIDLGKNKYGGPFTSEEVENVKTFLQLIKILMSLLGIFIVAFSINLDVYLIYTSVLASSNSVLINVLRDAVSVAVLLLLYIFLFLPRCQKCLPKMLKRIWIGAILTVASALSMLMVESITSGHNKTLELAPCMVTLNTYLLLIPKIFQECSYIIFTISLFEFIIAQSPHTMKGMLIGLYYSLCYGLVGLYLLAEYYAFHKYPAHGYVLNCATAHYLEITLIGLLSLLVFTIVACKYKLRERDEVVNVHIFAEEYYTKT